MNVQLAVPYWYCDSNIYIYNAIHKEEYYKCVFQQVIHISERDLALIIFSHFYKQSMKQELLKACMHTQAGIATNNI